MSRREYVLILRRNDHKRDALGAVFLGAITDEEEVWCLVERYLGVAIQVRAIEAEAGVLRVTVGCSRFEVESQNLVRLAKSLVSRGRQRTAVDSFGEALKLDPLNTDALKGQAAAHLAAEELSEAEAAWVHAGEIRGYDGEMLRGLALVALRQRRHPSAMQYLDEALLVNPDDAEAHAMLDELNRQAELRFNESAGGHGGDEGSSRR